VYAQIASGSNLARDVWHGRSGHCGHHPQTTDARSRHKSSDHHGPPRLLSPTHFKTRRLRRPCPCRSGRKSSACVR
jgi:hypothetical protein